MSAGGSCPPSNQQVWPASASTLKRMAVKTPETHTALVRRAREIKRVLAETYPDAHCELDFKNPFQLLVATVLSAQTTDKRVNLTTPVLFAKYPTPEDLAAANPEDVAEILRPTGFFNAKTKSVMGLSAALVERFGGEVPRTLEEMVTLPGVGRKTANVVLGNAYGIPGITVDTHFGRLSRRFGWTTSDDPVKVEAEVGELIPKKDWVILSHRLIWHGRRICHARKPACGACPVADWCPGVAAPPRGGRRGDGRAARRPPARRRRPACGGPRPVRRRPRRPGPALHPEERGGAQARRGARGPPRGER